MYGERFLLKIIRRIKSHPFGRRIYLLLPLFLRVRIGYYLFSTLKSVFDGPFNGQEKRKNIFFKLNDQLKFLTIVETGTYLGETSGFFVNNFNVPFYTCENDPECFLYSKLRLKKFNNCHLFLDSSVDFLKKICLMKSFKRHDVFFYLDAHWQGCLPLKDEIAIIAENFSSSIIMIDDFEVLGDDGYGYDDYGKIGTLGLSYIDPLVKKYNLNVFFPSIPSEEETGWRRGYVILITPDVPADKLCKIDGLKRCSKV